MRIVAAVLIAFLLAGCGGAGRRTAPTTTIAGPSQPAGLRVGEGDHNLARAIHHMTVGKHESVWSEHKTGATALDFPRGPLRIA